MKFIIIAKSWYSNEREILNADDEWCCDTDRPMLFDSERSANTYIEHHVNPKFPYANCDFIVEKLLSEEEQ